MCKNREFDYSVSVMEYLSANSSRVPYRVEAKLGRIVYRPRRMNVG